MKLLLLVVFALSICSARAPLYDDLLPPAEAAHEHHHHTKPILFYPINPDGKPDYSESFGLPLSGLLLEEITTNYPIGIISRASPTPPAAGASITLAWSASTNSTVVGYNIYWGTVSRTYNRITTFGNVTIATIPGLSGNTTYYFAATAFDATGLESGYSNEAVGTTPKHVHKFTVQSAPKVTGAWAYDPRFPTVFLTNLYLLDSNGFFRLAITNQ